MWEEERKIPIDPDQLRALQSWLGSKFIQGPPLTGKDFIGQVEAPTIHEEQARTIETVFLAMGQRFDSSESLKMSLLSSIFLFFII